MNWRILLAFFGILALAFATNAVSQQAPMKHGPGRVMISIYKAAPGKHLDLVKWMAAREGVEKEVGGMTPHWFMHTEGADWDFVVVSHLGSEKEEAERAAKIDELLKKKGISTAMAASLEFRQLIGAHTDTYAAGPYTASELVKEMEKK